MLAMYHKSKEKRFALKKVLGSPVSDLGGQAGQTIFADKSFFFANCTLRSDAEFAGYLFTVKAHHDIIAYLNDRDAKLAGKVDHLGALVGICGHIVGGILNALFGKKLFSHLAKVAGRGRINSYLFFHTIY